MAKRRVLKKNVNILCEMLLLQYLLYVDLKKETIGNTDELFSEILALRNEFISRISHTEKGSEKLFYKKFNKDFGIQFEAVVSKFEKLAK
ncbi:MAG: hypothetical protein KBH23_01725 [Bacteroidaceae bacterium]|nr:hypothetical protein [Bacteroidaceae bacterium]MBP9637826.1 hypothetical protein [Bacteroidaceae bacterium]